MSEIMHKKLFEISGDDDFKEKTYHEIRALLGVKPGRLLIKELMKLCELFQEHISIKSGEKFYRYANNPISMNINGIRINLNPCLDDDYNALAGACLKNASVLALRLFCPQLSFWFEGNIIKYGPQTKNSTGGKIISKLGHYHFSNTPWVKGSETLKTKSN